MHNTQNSKIKNYYTHIFPVLSSHVPLLFGPSQLLQFYNRVSLGFFAGLQHLNTDSATWRLCRSGRNSTLSFIYDCYHLFLLCNVFLRQMISIFRLSLCVTMRRCLQFPFLWTRLTEFLSSLDCFMFTVVADACVVKYQSVSVNDGNASTMQ